VDRSLSRVTALLMARKLGAGQARSPI